MVVRRSHHFSLYFSSGRVQSSGSVDNHPVPAIAVDTATDISVVSQAWLMSHPTLRSVTIQPVPPSAVALRAANGSPLDILGFVVFTLTLSTITQDVEALALPALGPDSILLDKKVMSNFGAVLDWENQTTRYLVCHLHLLVNLSQQFIVLATPPPAQLTPPLPATQISPSLLSTVMQ